MSTISVTSVCNSSILDAHDTVLINHVNFEHFYDTQDPSVWSRRDSLEVQPIRFGVSVLDEEFSMLIKRNSNKPD